MADLTLKDAFDMYQKQSDGLHKLWTYFQVISLAVLGYTLGSDKAQWGDATYIGVALSYLFFAVSNGIVIYRSQKELRTLEKAVTEAAKVSGQIGQGLTINSLEAKQVAGFHAVAALIVVIAIGLTWKDKCYQKTCPAPAPAVKTS